MFERFTDRARRAIVLAQEEARSLNHNYIGTEHILLGLVGEGEGVAAKALDSLGIKLDTIREQIEEIIGRGLTPPTGHIPFTPRAKTVLELSLREALQLGHNYIGTEHILLGLIREGEGVAAQVLIKLGAELDRVRQQVIALLHAHSGKKTAVATSPSEPEPAEVQVPAHLAAGVSSAADEGCRDLTVAAKAGELEPVVGWDREIGEVLQALANGSTRGVLLICDSGEQAAEVVAGLTQNIAAGRGHQVLEGRRICALDLTALIVALPAQVMAGADTRRVDRKIAKVRMAKGAAIDRQDFETAAGLRDDEKRLIAERDEAARKATPDGLAAAATIVGEIHRRAEIFFCIEAPVALAASLLEELYEEDDLRLIVAKVRREHTEDQSGHFLSADFTIIELSAPVISYELEMLTIALRAASSSGS